MINMELFHLNFLYSKLIFMLYVEISWSAGRLLPNKEKTPTQITSDKVIYNLDPHTNII